MLAVAQFTTDEVRSFWPELERMLDAVPHTWKHWTKEWIVTSIEEGRIRVWGVGPPPKAVFVMFTEISSYPAMKVLNITWAAGHMPEGMFEVLAETLAKYAKLTGCDEVEVRGRRGWHPHLKRLKFRRDADVWTRPVMGRRMN